MPTIIRKSQSLLVETKRESSNAMTWHLRSKVWRPPTDVYETEMGVIVRVEIAGVREEDFEVIVEDNLLFITGVRSDSSERRAYHQMEIPFGRFSVDIELPTGVITQDANAEYKDGLLIIYLPKEMMDK